MFGSEGIASVIKRDTVTDHEIAVRDDCLQLCAHVVSLLRSCVVSSVRLREAVCRNKHHLVDLFTLLCGEKSEYA